jgi:outer membrane receptor protein involved in Fe transport
MIIEGNIYFLKNYIKTIFLLLILPGFILAGAKGKIMGRITDAVTGELLPGAHVILTHAWNQGEPVELISPMGAATDLNGEFVVLNVHPGIYTIEAGMIGYARKIYQKIRVSINRTTPLIIELNEEAIEGETIVVEAQREAIKRDMTSAMRTISSEDLENFIIESVSEAVKLQPGVVEGHFRGGRSGEVSYLVDGVQSGIGIHADAVQEIEIISGTFNAEYGKVMSGIVNVVPREGGSIFTGGVRLFTGNYLTSHDYVGLDASEIFHRNEIRLQFGGPLPYTNNKINLFIFGTVVNDDGLFYGIRRYNMGDYTFVGAGIPESAWIDDHTGNMAEVPMSEGMSRALMANLIWRVVPGFKFGILYQHDFGEGMTGYNHGYKYLPDRTNRRWNTDNSVTFSFNHAISANAFHELKAMYSDHDYQTSRFKDPFDPGYVHDLYSNSIGGFATGGNDKNFYFQNDNRLELKYDLTWQINNHHEIKTGIDYVYFEFGRREFSLQNKWDNTEYEATRYEPVIYPDSTTYSDSYNKNPIEFSVYIQDKSEFDKLVINFGLRFDWFDPQTIYPSDLRNPANQIVTIRRSDYNNAKPQYQLSPRLGLSYQLGDAAALHFSYGHFFQIPNYGHMFQNPNYEIASSNYASTIGNPNIKAEKTVKYELGLQLKLLEGMVLNTDVFYHNIYNLETVVPIETYDAIMYGYYTNKDYASSKGLTVGLDYFASKLSLNVSYTLQYAEGNASTPNSNFVKAAQDIDPIKKLVPLDWDQRHTFNFAAGYNAPLYGLSVIGSIGSGTRYTFSPPDKSRLAIANIPENDMTKPPTFSFDFKGYYDLDFMKFKDIIPRLGIYIYNLFDIRNELSVYNDSGRAGSTISLKEKEVREAYVSTFTTIEDQYARPNYYSSPRMWKIELSLKY